MWSAIVSFGVKLFVSLASKTQIPRPSGFDRQFRQGWSVWLDPARFWGGSM